MSITAAQVKELRALSGAGMMDCKAALAETGGNIEEAVDWLRKKGIAKAEKKAGRTAAEGLIGLAESHDKAVLVEINSETDFVARNELFQELVRHVAQVALETDGSYDKVGAALYAGSNKTVVEALKDAVGSIGENITFRRACVAAADGGVVASYIHGGVAPGLGRLGVLVVLRTAGNKEEAKNFGRQVAMHIAATNPLALNVEQLDSSVVEREKAIFVDQARQSGKPDNIIEKMVEGRLRKFYEEVVLLSQPFVINPEKTVKEALQEAEKSVGAPMELVAFYRFAVGEGIEKEITDFSAEVAAAVKG